VKRLLALYPRAWRDRYGAEMAAVLDDLQYDPRTAFDLAVCAVDAHLHPIDPHRRGFPPIGQVVGLVLLGLVTCWFASRARPTPTDWWTLGVSLATPVAWWLLAALATWRVGWRAGAWFCGLVALQIALGGGQAWAPRSPGPPLLDTLRPAAAAMWLPASFRSAWPFLTVAVAASAVPVAHVLRRLGVGWPGGFVIAAVLVGCTDVELAFFVNVPRIWADWFHQVWLVSVAESAAWAAVATALLRRGGHAWRTAVAGGGALALLLSGGGLSLVQVAVDATESPGVDLASWQLPTMLWAAVLASLAARPAGAVPGAAPTMRG